MTVPAPVPPPPVSPPTPPAGRPPTRRRAPLVAVAVAVLAGCAGLGLGRLLWAGGDGAASGTGLRDARADAVAACQVFRRVPELSAVMADPRRDSEARYNRSGAAAALAHAAALLDDHYKPLDTALRDVSQRLQVFAVKGPEAVAAHKKVLTLCATYG
jgi:hypothetical protein